MKLGYLRTEDDIKRRASSAAILSRTVKLCARRAGQGFITGRGLSRLRIPYWVCRYYLGLARRPLISEDRITFRVAQNGRKAVITLRKKQSDLFVLQNVMLHKVYNIHPKLLKNTTTVIDLGANIGLSALFFSLYSATIRTLVCVEPTAEAVDVLRMNMSLNNAHWHIYQAAISPTNQSLTLSASDWSGSNTVVSAIGKRRQSSHLRPENAMNPQSRPVAATTIPTILHNQNIDKVDLLKIDIEGMEEQLLASNPGWLSRVATVVIEVHDKYIDGDSVRAVLRKAGLQSINSPNPDCEVYTRLNISLCNRGALAVASFTSSAMPAQPRSEEQHEHPK